MPIEFACSICQSVLRTADETAGKAARCPSCGNVQAIPSLPNTANDNSPFGGKVAMPPLKSDSMASPPYKDSSHGDQEPWQENPFLHVPQPPQPTNNPYAAVAPSEYLQNRPIDLLAAKSKVQPAAITLLVLNSITLLVIGMGLFGGLMELATGRAKTEDFVLFVVMLGFVAMILLGIGGCVCMLNLKNRPLAITGIICSMVSGIYCCFIPSGFAIWALVVVLDRQVTPFFR